MKTRRTTRGGRAAAGARALAAERDQPVLQHRMQGCRRGRGHGALGGGGARGAGGEARAPAKRARLIGARRKKRARSATGAEGAAPPRGFGEREKTNIPERGCAFGRRLQRRIPAHALGGFRNARSDGFGCLGFDVRSGAARNENRAKREPRSELRTTFRSPRTRTRLSRRDRARAQAAEARGDGLAAGLPRPGDARRRRARETRPDEQARLRERNADAAPVKKEKKVFPSVARVPPVAEKPPPRWFQTAGGKTDRSGHRTRDRVTFRTRKPRRRIRMSSRRLLFVNGREKRNEERNARVMKRLKRRVRARRRYI